MDDDVLVHSTVCLLSSSPEDTVAGRASAEPPELHHGRQSRSLRTIKMACGVKLALTERSVTQHSYSSMTPRSKSRKWTLLTSGDT
jgi:hypothetical protein